MGAGVGWRYRHPIGHRARVRRRPIREPALTLLAPRFLVRAFLGSLREWGMALVLALLLELPFQGLDLCLLSPDHTKQISNERRQLLARERVVVLRHPHREAAYGPSADRSCSRACRASGYT